MAALHRYIADETMADAEEVRVFGIIATLVFLAFSFAREAVGEFVQLFLELGDPRAVVGREYDGVDEFCSAQSFLGSSGVELRKFFAGDSKANSLSLFVVHLYLLIP